MSNFDRFQEPDDDCKPEVIGGNEDNVPDYNCEDCDQTDCKHWLKFNEYEVIEDENAPLE